MIDATNDVEHAPSAVPLSKEARTIGRRRSGERSGSRASDQFSAGAHVRVKPGPRTASWCAGHVGTVMSTGRQIEIELGGRICKINPNELELLVSDELEGSLLQHADEPGPAPVPPAPPAAAPSDGTQGASEAAQPVAEDMTRPPRTRRSPSGEERRQQPTGSAPSSAAAATRTFASRPLGVSRRERGAINGGAIAGRTEDDTAGADASVRGEGNADQGAAAQHEEAAADAGADAAGEAAVAADGETAAEAAVEGAVVVDAATVGDARAEVVVAEGEGECAAAEGGRVSRPTAVTPLGLSLPRPARRGGRSPASAATSTDGAGASSDGSGGGSAPLGGGSAPATESVGDAAATLESVDLSDGGTAALPATVEAAALPVTTAEEAAPALAASTTSAGTAPAAAASSTSTASSATASPAAGARSRGSAVRLGLGAGSSSNGANASSRGSPATLTASPRLGVSAGRAAAPSHEGSATSQVPATTPNERLGGRPAGSSSRAGGGRGGSGGGAVAPSPAADGATRQAFSEWLQAKRERDYATADAIRAELRAKGVEPEELSASLRAAAARAASADERGTPDKLGGGGVPWADRGGSGGAGGGGGGGTWSDRAGGAAPRDDAVESLEEQLGLKPPPRVGRVAEVLRQQQDCARMVGARGTSAGTSAGASSTAASPSMARVDAEALAEAWMEARRERDYATADAIRARLRAHGLQADEIAADIEAYGRTPTGGTAGVGSVAGGNAGAGTAGAGTAGAGAAVGAGSSGEDPLAYKPTVRRPEGLEFGPTDLAARHKDGGTGGLLTLNYSAIEPLPEGIGFTVTSSHFSATAEPLLALKRLQLEEEAKEKEVIRQRNAQRRHRSDK